MTWEDRLREIESLTRVTASEIALAASEALEGYISCLLYTSDAADE